MEEGTVVVREMDHLHLPSMTLSSFLAEYRCFFYWLVKKAQQGLEMQSMKWNCVCSFKNEQPFRNATFASCTHQYTCTPRPFRIIQKFSLGESITYYESIKSLWICHLYGSIIFFCLLLLIWVCIKIICVTVVYEINFQPMHDINMTLENYVSN